MQKYLSKRLWKQPVPQWPWQHLSWKSQWHFCLSAPQCYDPCFSFGLHLLLALLLCLSQRLAACCTKPERPLPRKRQPQCVLQKDFNRDHTGTLQTLLGKSLPCIRGNREVTDHRVRVAKQNWVSLTQWKVKAEMERITSKNEKFFMRKGELKKDVHERLM